MTQLGSLVDINPRSAAPSKSGPISVIGVPDIDAASATAKPRIVADLAAARSARRPAQPGDILFARISPSMENGKVAIAPELQTEQLVVSGELLVLRPRPGVDPRIVWAFLRQPAVRKELGRFMTGSAGQQRLSAEILEQVDLPEPEQKQWRRAVDVLARLDAARELAGRIGQLVEMLPAAIAASIASQWPKRELGTFDIDFRYGTSERSAPQGSLPVLRIPNVVEGWVDSSGLQYMANPKSPVELLMPRDLLVVRTNGNPERLGRTAVYESDPPEATFASYLIRARCHDLDPDFLWAWLRTGATRSHMLGRALTTAGQYNLNIEQLKQIPVPKLGPSEEERIAALARRARTLSRLNAEQLEFIDRTVASHLAVTFDAEAVAPSPQRAEAMLAPEEIFLPEVFAFASERQQRLWTEITERQGNFGLSQLGTKEEHARLQHDLAILEQLGVVVRDVSEEAYSWRRPDPDLELLT